MELNLQYIIQRVPKNIQPIAYIEKVRKNKES